nr:MAG TPA: hypothetical protein [Caudoviricetes sp.]
MSISKTSGLRSFSKSVSIACVQHRSLIYARY